MKPAYQEHEDKEVLEVGCLKKTGAPYEIYLATADDIDEILALQSRVYEDLPPQKKNFIVPKSRAFFQDHLDKDHPILLVMSDGKCIAQSIIRAPSVNDPDIGMTDMDELKSYSAEELTILQGVICDPDYRGNALMEQMVGHWLQWALANDRPYALAEIEVRNHHSWSVFMKQGMWLVGLGRDEQDGARLYNAFQNLEDETGKVKYRVMKKLGQAFADAVGASQDQDGVIECARGDLPKQHDLMKQGYGCENWDAATQTMKYSKRKF